MTEASTPPSHGGGVDPRTLAFLQSGKAFGGKPPARRIDTHAASIFLTSDRAWKLKRPVRLGYLDFSTAEARHQALEAEERLNRRTAPTLYHGVHAITRAAGDELALDGSGTPVDWLLEMDRFPDDALLCDQALRGPIDTKILLALADAILSLHAKATIVLGAGAAHRFQQVVDGNAAAMARYPEQLDPRRVERFCRQARSLAKAFAPRLEARGRRGHVRRCHGDLHLANIAVINGVPTLFDCLEFDENLATTDVLYDLAFLLMDLWFRGLRQDANIIVNRYLDGIPDEESGLGLLPLFMAVRAQIRAHVAAARPVGRELSSRSDVPTAYLGLGEDLLRTTRPSIVAIGGLSGSGKSTIARRIGGLVGRAPGARILRSDVVRKQRAKVAPDVRLPVDAYNSVERRAVYAELCHRAGLVLADGQAVLTDAVFAVSAQRAAIEAVAKKANVDFTGIWLDAPEDLRVVRVTERGPDASDATPDVVRLQTRHLEAPQANWIRVASTGSIDDVTLRVRRVLGLAG